jgi:hypothetical protein
MVLNTLRAHHFQARTSELAAWTGLPSSVVRRAGLYLASKQQLDARLEPGRGKGEYVFTIVQLDLFADTPKDLTIWQRIKRWFQ